MRHITATGYKTIISGLRKTRPLPNTVMEGDDRWMNTVHNLVRELKKDNPKFNSLKFWNELFEVKN